MKTIKLNILMSSLLAAILIVLTFVSCNDDKAEIIQYETASLESLIVEAEALVQNNEEGTTPGLYKSGSKKELQDVLAWAKLKFENAKSQKEITEAIIKLQNAIDTFKLSLIKAAIPYINQTPGSYIQISDNIKYTIGGTFTIEVDCYILDLNQLGYSNNLFSCEQMGPDSGFAVRYFGDGHIEIVVGNNDWKDVKSDPDIMKVGEWIHVALSNTGSTQKLYVNGNEILTMNHTHLPAANSPLVIGNGSVFNDRVVNALVKNVRIWNTTRTESEITNNFDTALTGNESGLAAYFPLDADLGNEFKDFTGNYTATFVSNVKWLIEGIIPEMTLDYTSLNKAIEEAEKLKPTIVEGQNDGDYPSGTIAYIQTLIDGGKNVLENAKWQKDVDKEAYNIRQSLEVVKDSNIKPTLPPEGKYSAIFGGGPFYSGGDAVINDLRNSGFTTAILWTIHIGEDGSMIYNDKAVIDKNGNYVGDPEWKTRLSNLLQAPTTIDRIELGIGAWGSKSWENIKALIDAEGTGTDTKLYKALETLKDITGASAINYDDELTYDVESSVKFSLILADMGLKISLCPYTNTEYWKSVYEQVETQKPGTIDRVYLQCYDGGAANTPSAWNQHFGNLQVSMGLWSRHGYNCESGDTPSEILSKITNEKENISGGFIWLYDDIKTCSEYGKTQAYTKAVNQALE
jgi:hypothetical protein